MQYWLPLLVAEASSYRLGPSNQHAGLYLPYCHHAMLWLTKAIGAGPSSGGKTPAEVFGVTDVPVFDVSMHTASSDMLCITQLLI